MSLENNHNNTRQTPSRMNGFKDDFAVIQRHCPGLRYLTVLVLFFFTMLFDRFNEFVGLFSGGKKVIYEYISPGYSQIHALR